MPNSSGPADAHAWRNGLGNDSIVVAFGVGVDSTALLIGLRERRVIPDLIVFADTNSEKPEAIRHLTRAELPQRPRSPQGSIAL